MRRGIQMGQSQLFTCFIASKDMPGMCPGGEPSLTKTNRAGFVLLASLLLIWQEFKLDFIELLYCFFICYARTHIA